LILAVALLALSLSGCTGGVRATSWTGLNREGDQLYVADLTQVHLLDAASGDIVWSFPTDPRESNRGYFYVTPTVNETAVVVASQVPARGLFSQPQNIVWALDREDGRDLWRFDGAEGEYVEGGALGEDTFVIGNSDGSVYALDLETGDLRWSFETGHRVWATPLIVGDTVYVGSMDRHLYALNISDGEIVWDFETKGAFASQPVLEDGTLYIGAFDDKLYAIDAETGEERWHFAGENWFWGGLTVHQDVLYAVDVDGNAYALDLNTGDPIWHQALLGPDDQAVAVRAGPTLTEDYSKLLVGSEDGLLFALDTADGSEVWNSAADGQVLTPPVVGEETVYEARIYAPFRVRALRVDNGNQIWAYPPPDEE
jgi:outer membrane protein assembly factor BamB